MDNVTKEDKIKEFDIGRSYQMLLDSGCKDVSMKDVMDNLPNLSKDVEWTVGEEKSYEVTMEGLRTPSIDNTLYLGRCFQYICSQKGKLVYVYNMSHHSYPNRNKDLVEMAHKTKNESILRRKVFPGCHGLDTIYKCGCGQEKCTWTFGQSRCSCQNYKGFTWEYKFINLVEDISLDSNHHVGYQYNNW